jgi:hypothetical protein
MQRPATSCPMKPHAAASAIPNPATASRPPLHSVNMARLCSFESFGFRSCCWPSLYHCAHGHHQQPPPPYLSRRACAPVVIGLSAAAAGVSPASVATHTVPPPPRVISRTPPPQACGSTCSN